MAPFGDLAVIARKQNLRNLPALEVAGPRKLRIFEQAALERPKLRKKKKK
jgi:hypothetical protein